MSVSQSFQREHHLLDSLVPDIDKIPSFLQRAVQKNNDLREIHVLDSVWRSIDWFYRKVYFEVYNDILWNAVYQHDLNNATRNKK